MGESVRDVEGVFSDGEHATHRKESELDRQDEDEQQPEPERRHGVPGHPEHADELVDPGAAIASREDPQRDTYGDRQQQRQRGQQ